MPDQDWPNRSPLLSGLFGFLQTAAQGRFDTASVWQGLRVNAATWAWQASGQGELPSEAELEAQGRQILSEQGVGIQTVNTYRGIANTWRTAKANLHSLDPDEQIPANAIFRPPWATTTALGVPDRYRVRVEWEVTPEQGDAFTAWGTYELDSPLTSLRDILDQAGALVAKKPTSDTPLGATVTGVNDYELEQI